MDAQPDAAQLISEGQAVRHTGIDSSSRPETGLTDSFITTQGSDEVIDDRQQCRKKDRVAVLKLVPDTFKHFSRSHLRKRPASTFRTTKRISSESRLAAATEGLSVSDLRKLSVFCASMPTGTVRSMNSIR